MITPNPKDFTVDIGARKVHHKSGAAVSFDEYETESDWLATDVCRVHNPDLFPGPSDEFARGAKEAAIAKGMKCRRP